MKSIAIFIALLIAVVFVRSMTSASLQGGSSEENKGIRATRLLIHSRSLYAQTGDDPSHGATVFRLPIDKPDVVERIVFPLRSASKRLGPWMKLSGSDIYLLSVSDRGGSQFSVGVQKFSVNDIVRGPGDYFRPVQISTPVGMTTKRQIVNIDPFKDAVVRNLLPFSVKTRTWKTLPFDKDGNLKNPADNIRVWLDISVPGDGFLYLYILEDEGFSIWKREITSFDRPVNSLSPDDSSPKTHQGASYISPFWQKTLEIEGIPAEPFWVANDGSFTTITTASGKVYNLQGKTLTKRADSFTSLTTSVAGTERSPESGTVYIDDLDSGEQWSVSLDAAGKVLSKPHHLKRDSLISEELPGNLSTALQKALSLSKSGKTSR
jgi:hypothetical protein